MRCGIGDHTRELAPYLVKEGLELDVVTYDEGTGATPEIPGVRVVRTLRRSDSPWRVARALQEASPHAEAVLVESQTFLHPRAFNLFPLFWKGPPIVTMAHDAPVLPRLVHASIFLRRLYRASSRIVIMSDVTERALVDLHGVEPARLVHTTLGVDLASHHRRLRSVARRRALGWAEEERIVLFLGFVNEGKGVLTLLEAFAKISPGRPAVRLVYAGDDGSGAGVGGCIARLRRRAEELGILDRVRFEGFVSDRSLPDRLANADIVALPYEFSYQSAVLFRALGCGATLVATDIPGFSRWLKDGENALLVPPRDADALANALARLLDDDVLAASLGHAAAALALDEHGLERTARDIRHALDDAVHAP